MKLMKQMSNKQDKFAKASNISSFLKNYNNSSISKKPKDTIVEEDEINSPSAFTPYSPQKTRKNSNKYKSSSPLR